VRDEVTEPGLITEQIISPVVEDALAIADFKTAAEMTPPDR
jgi:hypothetical protein